jgi:hypothetical protein
MHFYSGPLLHFLSGVDSLAVLALLPYSAEAPGA